MFNDSTPAAHGVEKISAHPLDPERAAHTLAGGEGAFQKLLQFWAQVASEFEWIKPWDTVRKGEMPSLEFFSGGIMNPCINLLDRHVRSGNGGRLALIWEGEDGASISLTYKLLLDEVCRFGNVLKSLGVKRGDAVAIFLPNVAECLIAIPGLLPPRSHLQHSVLRLFDPGTHRSHCRLRSQGRNHGRFCLTAREEGASQSEDG